VGIYIPEINLRRVDFPAPLGPITLKNSPFFTSKERLFTAVKSIILFLEKGFTNLSCMVLGEPCSGILKFFVKFSTFIAIFFSIFLEMFCYLFNMFVKISATNDDKD